MRLAARTNVPEAVCARSTGQIRLVIPPRALRSGHPKTQLMMSGARNQNYRGRWQHLTPHTKANLLPAPAEGAVSVTMGLILPRPGAQPPKGRTQI